MAQKKDIYWLKSAILTTLQSLSGVLFGFGSFYFLVRLLSKSDFGVWTLFTATTTILEFIRNGMIQSALIRFLAGADESEKPHIISASFSLSGIITAAIIVVNFCFAGLLSHLWKTPVLVPMLFWFNALFLFSGLLTQFQSIEQAGLKFNGIFLSTMVRQGGLFVYVLAAHLLGFNLELINLVYVQLICTALSVLVSYAFVHNAFKVARGWHRNWISKLFHYGKYAFGTTLSAMLSNSIDQMMLGGMLSAASAGAYNVAVRTISMVEIPTSSIATIVFPQSAKKMETEGIAGVKYLYEKSVGAALAVLLPGLILLFAFANLVVDFVAGQSYAESIPVLRVTVVYCLLMPFGRQFGTILNAIGRPKITFYVVLISGAINALFNYFFIIQMGVMGAAWATLCAAFIGFVIGQVILKRELGISTWAPFRYALLFYPEFYTKYFKRSAPPQEA